MSVAPLSVRDKHTLARYRAVLHELTDLDLVWTDALDAPTQRERDETEAVHDVGRRMHELLAEASESASRVKRVLLGHPALVRSVSARIGESDRLSVEEREHWNQLVNRAPDEAHFAGRAVDLVAGHASAAQNEINDKRAALGHGEAPPGDLPAEILCGSFIGLAIGGGVIGAWPGAFVAAAAAGYYCGQIEW